MKPEAVKKALNVSIQAITDYKWLYSVRPGKFYILNSFFKRILRSAHLPCPFYRKSASVARCTRSS